ncbi:MAG: phosphate ABC transporter permease subunit PstC [Thermodesulfobacteriota bacterium]
MPNSISKGSSLTPSPEIRVWRRFQDRAIHRFFQFNGLLSILILLGIFFLLLTDGFPAIKNLGASSFFSMIWNPTSYVKETYGLGAMIISTLMVTLGAMIIAVPVGLGCAAYLAEVAPGWIREILKPVIEILAGIPSVVLGFLGIVVIGPVIAEIFNLPNGLNALNGAVLLAVMSLPTIISISEDAITSVPRAYKEASLALGATRWQTLIKVVVPSALSGIIASIMLGMGRAIGETMTVLMATGNALKTPHHLFDSVRTMTSTIAIELGEVPFGSDHYHGLFVIGFILFLMTFAVNLVADMVLAKYQEVER